MQFQTTRFGLVTVSETDLITFKEGLLGFSELRKFVLLDDPNDEIFAWLQSCERPGVAFPVLEPELFTTDYKVNLSKHDLEALSMKIEDRKRVFNIVTIPEDVTLMTANMKAPVVINIKDRCAKQIVAQENDYQIKHLIFAELQKRVVQNPQVQFKASVTAGGVAVRLPLTPATNKDLSV
ncbi:MAG: flagellar assembly protein FliW [Oligoflexia bacterium]|nr:flagellar assembly protein FliW [Oligoflexia bacterium]